MLRLEAQNLARRAALEQGKGRTLGGRGVVSSPNGIHVRSAGEHPQLLAKLSIGYREVLPTGRTGIAPVQDP